MQVKLDGRVTLNVRSKGDGGPDVVLLHGWAVSSEVWHSVFERWPESGAGRLLAVDLRGTGWSDKPETGYSLDDYAGDISALIDALDLKDITLVGHSLGGVIAQRVALDRPEALARLVLVCPVPASGVPLDEGQIAYFRSLGGHYDGARQVITMTMAMSADEAELERLLVAASSVSTGAFLEGFDAWRTADFGDSLGNIKAPTTVLCGGGDQILPAAFLQPAIVDRIPGATLVELAGSGHYPQLEVADLLSETLRGLVSS